MNNLKKILIFHAIIFLRLIPVFAERQRAVTMQGEQENPNLCWEYKYSVGGVDGYIYYGAHGEDFEYGYFDSKEKNCKVEFINPKYGPHFVIPETYSSSDEKIYDVIGVEDPGFSWCHGQITITLSKNIREFKYSGGGNAYFFVHSDNPYFSSYDGSLYIKYNGERFGWLATQSTEIDEHYRFLPQTKGIGNFEGEIDGKKVIFHNYPSFYAKKHLSSFTIPSHISVIGSNALFIRTDVLNVKGAPSMDSSAFQYSKFEEFTLEGGETIPKNLMSKNDILVKVKLPESIKTIEDHAFYSPSGYSQYRWNNVQSDGVMYFNLPNVTRIEQNALGKPQAIKLGFGLDDPSDIYLDPGWHSVDKEKPLHVCLAAKTPPSWKQGIVWQKANWTLYVPEESVDLYKSTKYWGTRYIVEPIRDMLIPLVSEPELTLEMGDTHKYLWDVMPLGNAVPEETGVWSSLNPKVAIVDQNGRLTAYTAGKTDIVFTLKDTDGNEYTAISKVTVNFPAGVDDVIADEDPELDNQVNIQSIPDGVYNMHGQRVADSTEGLMSGLYIVRANGKTTKTIIR